MTAAETSCGVIVGDGGVGDRGVGDQGRILLGHATRSPRWDIPKGRAETGESHAEAAARELREETGLVVLPAALAPLGLHPYLRGKDLALFAWSPPAPPDLKNLVCTSHFALADGTLLPEFDRFGWFSWDEALVRVGRNMARVLSAIKHDASK